MEAKKITIKENFQYKYSICTLVTNLSEYACMLDSFRNAGFNESDCEFLYSDNSKKNEFEAFSGINRFLREAKGEFVIICHQDVLTTIDDRKKLEEQIRKVTRMDPNWAVLGNAGVNNLYNTSMVITHANKKCYRSGTLPSRVLSLDENFLLVKASSNLAVAGDLKGFHMYGTDICLVAECLGYSAYAIDFHLIHNGRGLVDDSFHRLTERLIRKYSSFFSGRYIKTTITSFYISSNQWMNSFMNIWPVKTTIRFWYKLKYLVNKNIA